jgi:sugar lactone lactonase YvrE
METLCSMEIPFMRSVVCYSSLRLSQKITLLFLFALLSVGQRSVAQVTVVPSISTVAGNGTAGSSGDGSAATSAKINTPYGVALDSAGNLYIADNGNNLIRKVDASTGKISTVAGNGTGGYSGDGGVATSAEIKYPISVALDSAGNIYIADQSNHRIRKVDASTGKISTVAGNGSIGYSGDGSAATSAELQYPAGVALDSAGNIYIADTFNQRIRKVDASTGKISTVAGNGTQGYSGDGSTATSAEFYYPDGLVVDSAGNLYIADEYNHRIRKVDAGTGKISTVAGNGTSGYSGDGGAATSAELAIPWGVVVDGAGNLYFSDSTNNRIRKVDVSASSLGFATATNAGSTDTTDGTQTATISNIGNGALTLAVPATGTNPSISTGFALNTATTCPQLSTSSSPSVLASGASCTLAVDFTPTAAGSASGSVVVTDDALNVASSMQSVSLSGTGLQSADTTATVLTASSTTVGLNEMVTLTAVVSDTTTTSSTPTGTVSFTDTVGTTITTLGSNTLIGGSATLKVSLTTLGTHAITAHYAGVTSSFLASSSGTASVTAEAVDHFTLTSVPSTATAGTAFSVTVTAYNSDGTVATGYTGTVHFTSTDPNAVLPQDTPLTSGTGTVSLTLKTAGAQTITVADSSGSPSVTSSSITTNAAVASAISVVSGSGQSATIGAAFSSALHVKVVDAYGNPLSGATVTFTAPASGASAVLSAASTTTASDGTASVTATANGTASTTAYTVSATITGATSASFTLTNNAVTPTLTVKPSATSLVYGQPVTVAATLSPASVGTTVPVAAMSFYDGTTTLTTSGTLASGSSSYAVSVPSVGSHTYAASYAGDTNFSAVAKTSATSALTVSQAVVTIAGSTTQPVSVGYGQTGSVAVMVTGQYSGSGISVPTGTLTYAIVNASSVTVTSGLATLIAGTSSATATITVPSTLATGGYTLSVSYGGDTNYSGSVITSSGVAVITVVALDFSFTGSSAMSKTVVPGKAASFTYALIPTDGSYPATVSFTVTGLPPGATYTLTPSTLAVNAGAQTVTLNIQTADIAAKNTSPLGGSMTLLLALLMLSMAGARRLRNSGQKLTRYIALLLLVAGLAGAAGLTGCGGGNGFLGTSPKNYAITVTATAGTVQRTITSTLNLQ